MLNVYFKVKTTPVVKSLDDIRQRTDFLISGIPYYFETMIKILGMDIHDLLARLNEDKDNTQDVILLPRTAEKVINSRSILIVNTFHREIFMIKK